MIREATLDDIPAIHEMAEVVFRQTYADILSAEQMEYMMDWMYSETNLVNQMTSLGHHYIIEDKKGYASFRFDSHLEDGTDLFHLEKLYVMPEYQRTGLGIKLFEKIVECVRSMTDNPIRIELNVNRNNGAVSFYEHIGLQKVKSGDFPIGKGYYMNDYIMSIDLEAV